MVKKVLADQDFYMKNPANPFNRKKIETSEAERASVKYKQIEYMSERTVKNLTE